MALLFQCSFWKLPILSLLFLIYLVPSVFLIPVSSFCIHVFSPQFFFAASTSFLFLSVLVLLPFPIVSWLFFTCDLLSSVPCWLIYPQFVYLSIYIYVSVVLFSYVSTALFLILNSAIKVHFCWISLPFVSLSLKSLHSTFYNTCITLLMVTEHNGY